MLIKRIDHVAIRVADIDETSRFYCALGLKVRKSGEQYALYGDGFKINVHVKGREFRPRTARPSTTLCLEVEGSLRVLVETMKALGYQPESEYIPKAGAHGPIISCYFRDPDNNLIELCSYAGAESAGLHSMIC